MTLKIKIKIHYINDINSPVILILSFPGQSLREDGHNGPWIEDEVKATGVA